MQFAMWIYPQEVVNGQIVYRLLLTTINYIPYIECGVYIEEEPTTLKHIFLTFFMPYNTSLFMIQLFSSIQFKNNRIK